MTRPGGNVTLRSRSGREKPISPAQIRALKVIAEVDAYWYEPLRVVMGVWADVYEVLERNGLVEILEETVSCSYRYRMGLTARGREVLDDA